MEEWRDIKGYEGFYQVSSLGKVKTLANNCFKSSKPKEMRLVTTPLGYKRVKLCKRGEHKTCSVHRLVAMAFLPNPENKPEVNHIDGNPSNNAVDNLEWVTSRENILHSYAKLGKKAPNCRRVRCLETGVVYPSTAEAGRVLGLNCMHIAGCCRGDYGRHQVKGTHWEWAQ